jgi:hypothetical protein
LSLQEWKGLPDAGIIHELAADAAAKNKESLIDVIGAVGGL